MSDLKGLENKLLRHSYCVFKGIESLPQNQNY